MRMEEEASSLWMFFVDKYWMIAAVFSFGLASWTAFVSFVLGLAYILRLILS